MQHARTSAARRGHITIVRWLLSIPLVLAIAGHAWVARWTLGEPNQDAAYYAVNALVDLLPVVLYGLAVIFVVAGGRHRVLWTVLLFCGAGLSLFGLYALAIGEWGELFIASPCLVALAVVQRMYPGAPATSLARLTKWAKL